MAFEPGRWKIGIATAGLLFSSERRAYWLEPSSTRAMSRRRVISPLAPARMMMFSNSSSVTRRPWVLIDNWKLVSLGRRRAQGAGGDLAVLLADGVDHVGGGEVARGDLVRVQPDAQRIVAEAEQLDVADAVETGQFVLHVEHRVVRQVEHVVAVIRRGQVHDHGQVGRGLVDGDAEPGHFFRELRLGPGDAVLHLHLGVVQVGAEGEGDGQGQLAVGGRLGGHVEHVLHPGDRLFQGEATVSPMTFGLAPGKLARTTTVGGTTSGYSLMGSWNRRWRRRSGSAATAPRRRSAAG